MNIQVLKEELEKRGIKKPSCRVCVWSIGTIDGLMCRKHQNKAENVCQSYMREMGLSEDGND